LKDVTWGDGSIRMRSIYAARIVMRLAAVLIALAVCSSCVKVDPKEADPYKLNCKDNAESVSNPCESPSILNPDDSKGLYTLKLVYIGAPQRDEELIEAAINEYIADRIQAKIDLMPIDWGVWDNKLNLMVASREQVDIIFTAQWSKYSFNVSKGAFLELDDLLAQHGQGILEQLVPVFLEGAKINGHNYGIPTNKELAAQGGIIYRADIAEELGIDMSKVKTVYDLEPVYDQVLRHYPSMIPLYMKQGETLNAHYMGNYDALGDTSIPGIILKDEDSAIIKPNYEVDRYLESLRISRHFYLKGFINKDAATSQMMVNDALKTNEVFSVVSSLKPGKAQEIAMESGMVGKLAQAELNVKTIATSETAGSMLAISSTSQDPVKAMKFINLLHTDAYLNNVINFGVEGVHYIKKENSIIQATEETTHYNPGSSWMLGNQFLNYVWDTEDPNKWERFKSFNHGAAVSPGLGFVFDGEVVRAESAAVVNVDRQYANALETGSVDPDKVLPEYVEKLKAAGIDVIIEEKQRQFDQFLASKSMKE